MYKPHLPSDLVSSLHGAIVVNLHVIKVTVAVVLHVEGVKRQSNQVPRRNVDVPRTVGAVRVVVGVTGTCNCARRTGQSITAPWWWWGKWQMLHAPFDSEFAGTFLTLYCWAIGCFKATVADRGVGLESDIHRPLSGLKSRWNVGTTERAQQWRARSRTISDL